MTSLMKFGLVTICLLSTALVKAQSDTAAYYAPNPNVKKKPAKTVPAYELPDPRPYAQGITAADAKAILEVLASAEYAGRETGEPGQRKAADYLAGQLKSAGFAPKGENGTYFQPTLMEKTSWTDIGLKVGATEYAHRKDFYVIASQNPDKALIKIKEVVFVGYGIEDAKYNDYGKLDVKGKAVIFYDGEPMDKTGKSLITGSDMRSGWSINWRKKIELAKNKGAVAVFIIDPQFEENLKNKRKQISTYSWQSSVSDSVDVAKRYINSMFVSPSLAEAIMGGKAGKVAAELNDLQSHEPFKPVKIKVKIEARFDKETKRLEGSNVLAVIEGSDPKLKDEYVFITAHYDHLGQVENLIYYGADDNGSGSTGLLEIARAFAEAKEKGVGPKRTVVCMWVSGEEKGLLGSRFYVDFPLFPLDKTVVDINIDMIGRIDDVYKDGNYVYVIGSDRLSSDLHEINERSNSTYTQMKLDYKYNDPNDPNHYYERSDHYNFAEIGIPAIFYFNGTHADYHKTTDTVDKINFDALAKRAQLAFYTAWDVANRPYRLGVDKKPANKK